MCVKLVIILCTFLAILEASNINSYYIDLPQKIQRGADVNVVVSIFQSENPIEVNAILSDGVIVLSSRCLINSNSTQLIAVGQVPITYRFPRTFKLNVTGTDSITRSNLFRNLIEPEFLDIKKFYIFAQTDKSDYVPGELVKFRALFLLPNLLPYNGTVHYFVNNIRNRYQNYYKDMVPLVQGVASGEVKLPRFGSGTDTYISFCALDYCKRFRFKVLHHTQIKTYRVFIEQPRFFKTGDKVILVTISSYDFENYPVKGVAKLLVTYTEPKPKNSPSYYRSITREIKLEIDSKNINNFNGEYQFYVTKEEAMENLNWDGNDDIELNTEGSVSSDFMKVFAEKIILNLQKTIEFLNKPDVITPRTYRILKPGLPYRYQIKVSNETTSNMLDVGIEYRQLYINDDVAVIRNYTYAIPSDGIVNFDLIVEQTDEIKYNFIQITASTNTTTGLVSELLQANVAVSSNNAFLNLSPSLNSSRIIGQFGEILIDTTDPIKTFRVIFVSRSVIIKQEVIERFEETAKTWHVYRFLITSNMMPDVFISIVYFRKDGTPVSDTLKYSIYAGSLMEVSVKRRNHSRITNEYEYEVVAGETVNVQVKTPYPNCFVGVKALDENYAGEVVEEFSDLLGPAIFHNIRRHQISTILPISTISNLPKYTSSFDRRVSLFHDEDRSLFNNTRFARSWVWESSVTNSNGIAEWNVTVPNQKTNWVWNVFSVCEQDGVQYKYFKMNSRREIFGTLDLPGTVIKHEIVLAQINILNGLNDNIEVHIELHKSNEFVVIPPNKNVQRLIMLARNVDYILVPIRILNLGKIKLSVTVSFQNRSQTITKTLISKVPGVKQCYSVSTLYESISKTKQRQRPNILSIYLPSNVVKNSTSVEYGLYGDVMEPTIRNLGDLVDVDRSEGISTLINLAPNLFCAIYLQKINKLSDVERSRILANVSQVYFEQLSYQKQDNSFVALNGFGHSLVSEKSRTGGRTWLTAFVLKCFNFLDTFSTADTDRFTLIRNYKIFLSQRQLKSGAFVNRNQYPMSKKGFFRLENGAYADVRLAALVLIAFKETEDVQYHTTTTRRAQDFLEQKLNSILEDKYTLAITTYALQIVRSRRTQFAIRTLLKLATRTKSGMYWHEEHNYMTDYKSQYKPNYVPPSTMDIEMTSYALLTFTRRNDIQKMVPIMKWLVSKRTAKGGFRSIHDTILAIQALSESAVLLFQRTKNKSLQVSASLIKGQVNAAISNVDEVNFNTSNIVNLPETVGTLVVNTEGTGMGVSQLDVCYNIDETPLNSSPFNCTLNVEYRNFVKNETVFVNICCKLNPGETPTGIFYIKLNFLSGFSSSVPALIRRNKNVYFFRSPSNVKSFVLDNEGLTIYYDELLVDQERCVNVPMVRDVLVYNIQPQAITVVDYFNPSRKFQQFYQVDEINNASLCKTCGYRCSGCPAPVEKSWSTWTECSELCKPENSTRTRFCVDLGTENNLEPRECGLNEYKVEYRSCPEAGFTCPILHDGLWKINHLQVSRSFSCLTSCATNTLVRFPSYGLPVGEKVPNFPPNSIPGTYTDRVTNNLTCPGLQLTNKGFTVSLLLKIDKLQKNISTSLFYYGQSFDFLTYNIPSYTLRKERNDTFIFQVIFGNRRYKIEFPDSVFLNGNWNHLVVTWKQNLEIQFYVNGRLLNTATIIDSNNILSRKELQGIGRKRLTHVHMLFTMKGYENSNIAYSSLSLWDYQIKSSEIKALIDFYHPLTTGHPDPLLSVRMIHQFLCPRFQKCFTKPAKLSSLDDENLPFVDC